MPFPPHAERSHQHAPIPAAPFPAQMSRILNPSRTTGMLRQEARMMRYNAHMMIQQSRLLEAQADMMDAEDDENHGYDGRNMYGRHPDNYDNTDNMSCITEHDSDVEVVPKVSRQSVFFPSLKGILIQTQGNYCFLFRRSHIRM